MLRRHGPHSGGRYSRNWGSIYLHVIVLHGLLSWITSQCIKRSGQARLLLHLAFQRGCPSVAGRGPAACCYHARH
eukprot:355827-Chlamydomonas_euryale.AAC.21